uniref:SSD domain-containing protein n=1 Tax=Setaria digitata TaxID=48799 RepID=A0A915PLP0_9BILA
MESYIREAGTTLGDCVARHPYRFAILPVCSFCLCFIPFLDSFGQLFREPSAIGSSKFFVPRGSASQRDKHKIEKIFPYGMYFYDRTFLSPNLRILNFELLSGSIYEPQFIEFYRDLRNKLESLSVRHNNDVISYSNLCAKAEAGRHCFPDVFFLSYTFLILSQPVQYPVWHLSIYNTSQSIFTGTVFGGVQTDSHSSIISARFVRMIFDFPPPYHIAKFDDLWDRYVDHKLKHPANIKVTKWSRSQYERDMKLIVGRTRRLLPLLAFCLVSFCCLSSVKHGSNLRFISISFYGVISAACGLVTAFGFLHIIGIRLVQVALVTPFLVLSTGIDDMFLMLSIWEQAIFASSGDSTNRYDLIRTTYRTYKYLKMYEEYFSEYNAPLEVVLANELDYFDHHLQRRILHAIAILENTNYTMKASFWLPVFLDFLRNQSNTDSISLQENLARFLHHPAYRSNAMHLIRSKAKAAEKRYSIRFVTYHVIYDLVEQDDLMLHLTFTNSALAGWLASTSVILLLTPSVMNCILIIWATFSINFGVFASLAVCGTRLDIISTIVILLSIGYSVDYSSHMLAHFHYFKNHSEDPIGSTLNIVCWPIVQASLSTIIGVICVSPVNGYIVKTFTRGVLSVCCIGLYHSIVRSSFSGRSYLFSSGVSILLKANANG